MSDIKKRPKTEKWLKYREAILETPKFLKQGTKVAVSPNTTPRSTEVEGRYGKRQMYIVETIEYGLIYVSPLQLVKIADAFDGNYESSITVEL